MQRSRIGKAALLASLCLAWGMSAQAQTYSRTEVITYHDNTTKWVLGQVAQVKCTSPTTVLPTGCGSSGTVISETTFDSATALPLTYFSFGKLQQTLTYSTDGTTATIKDGNNKVTTFSNWKRGIPQAIAFADTTSKSAAVNDNGWITSVTDENGFQTNYGYDVMGRLSLIDYPGGDTVPWTDTTITFAPATATPYGLPNGHWRRTESTGTARKITYYDALWRPIIGEVYDTANTWGTITQTVTRYDADGRPTFASYPQRIADPAVYATWANPAVVPNATGTWTTYDALGRPTQVQQNSELGLLTSTSQYLSNFQTLTTNPRGTQTVTQYQVFDQPSTETPNGITTLAGADTSATEIYRDIFGKPTQLKRRNSDGTLSSNRYYFYDSHQRLCKTVEPESGTTLYTYDNAGNLIRTNFGMQGWPSPCDEPAGMAALSEPPQLVPYALRTFDARNRLQTLSFLDGRGNQTWEYWPDGLAKKITTYNEIAQGGIAENNYAYNKRRLLTSETQVQPDRPVWGMGYVYNMNGALASLTYPSGLSVNYAPNALGQPTQAGSYATGVSYYPNGAMQQFTYGNGIVHTMTQNTRQLPERNLDSGGVLDDTYLYDANSNVDSITDATSGNRGNRDMGYDGLDRLITTTSPMFPGGTVYEYNALDNLTRVKAPGRDHYYCYDPNTWHLTNVKTGGCSGASVIGMSYDAQGNLRWKNNQDYLFDYGNRLRNVLNKESYRYDGYGRRVSAAATTGTIYSLYGQDGALRSQRDERKAEAYDYITLNGSLVARVTDPNSVVIGVPILTLPSLSDGNYTVQWTAVTGATRYELEEAFNGGGWQAVYSGTALSLPQSGKAIGTYIYRVRACKNTLCGNLSATATVLVGQAPASAPTLTAPAMGPSGNYSLSWTEVTTANSYVLEENVGGTWSQAYSGPLLGKAYGSKPTGSYGYRIKACNSYGCGAFSATSTVQVLYRPDAPTLSVPASSYTGSYTISWTPMSGATRYELRESFNSGTWNLVHNAATTSKAFTGKVDGVYSYQADACNAAGCRGSLTGNITVLTPPASAPIVTAPANNYTGAYPVSWTTVPKATSYTLNMSINGGTGTNIYSGAGTSQNVSGQGAAGYTYRVLACNGAGCAAWSAPVTTQVALVPAMPASLTGYTELDPDFPGSREFYVNWSAVPGATYYELTTTGIGANTYNLTSNSFSTSGKGTRGFSVRACNPAGCSASKGPLTL